MLEQYPWIEHVLIGAVIVFVLDLIAPTNPILDEELEPTSGAYTGWDGACACRRQQFVVAQ